MGHKCAKINRIKANYKFQNADGELLKYIDPSGAGTNMSNGGGTYPNLFNTHPQFQIDGNFGDPAAFADILVQSSENEITLMPALPDAWKEGSGKGLCSC